MARRFGLWPASRRIVAVTLDPSGRPGRPLVAERSPLARRAMLDFFASLPEVEIVVAQSLLQSDLVPHCWTDVIRTPTRVLWTAPDELGLAVAKAVGWQYPSPRRLAALLARLPSVPRWRRELSRLCPAAVQLHLL